MFYFWLAPLGKQFILFNLFNYIAFRAAGAGVTALMRSTKSSAMRQSSPTDSSLPIFMPW